MLIYKEETFGPVAPVIAFETQEEVLAMANDTNYGLASYVYTRDLSRALTMFEGLQFGIVGINDINPTKRGCTIWRYERKWYWSRRGSRGN